MLKPVKLIGIGLLLLAYPYLSTYLVGQGFASLELLVFAALTLWRGVKTTVRMLRYGSYLLGVLLLAAAFFANSYFIWLLPSLAYLWLMVLFGHTLWIPPSLCERFVRLIYPDFMPGMVEYLRELTWVWTLFFAVNAVLSALLALIEGQQLWALYTGLLVYVFMAVLAVGEWFYRQRRFPAMEMPPVKETLKYLAEHGYEVFRDGML